MLGGKISSKLNCCRRWWQCKMLLRGCSTVHLGDSSQRTARWQRCLPVGLHTAGLYCNIWAAFSEFFENHFTSTGDRDSSVGIATRYGLHGAGIKSRRQREFPHRSRLTQPASYKMIISRGKAVEAWCWHSPPSTAGSRMGSSSNSVPRPLSLNGRVMEWPLPLLW